MSKLKKLIIVLAILVVAIPASAFGYVYFKLNAMHDGSEDIEMLDKTEYKAIEGITNILLVGTDGLDSVDKGARSDSMMILTVDGNNKSMKLTSLARDTYADIPGHGKEKLTHAYAYGGIKLLVQTIEKTFELDIQNYAVVNFESFMDIVDAVDGVDIDVKSSEIEELNKYINDGYNIQKSKGLVKNSVKYINKAGKHKLNGYQSLAYARIRYNDSAIERDSRQRQLIKALATKASSLSVTKYPGLVNAILPHVKTNMRPTEIIGLATGVLGFKDLGISQFAYPINDNVVGKGSIKPSKGWVLEFDKKSLTMLHDFMFENKTKLTFKGVDYSVNK